MAFHIVRLGIRYSLPRAGLQSSCFVIPNMLKLRAMGLPLLSLSGPSTFLHRRMAIDKLASSFRSGLTTASTEPARKTHACSIHSCSMAWKLPQGSGAAGAVAPIPDEFRILLAAGASSLGAMARAPRAAKRGGWTAEAAIDSSSNG